MTARTIDDVTCLGCGCACDDIRVVVEDERIIDAQNACVLGRAWFGDGTVVIPRSRATTDLLSEPGGRPRVTPARSPVAPLTGMTDVSVDTAIDAATDLLTDSVRPLVYLAPGISCEAQREAAAVADVLRARLDSVTSATALPVVIAAQERGFASATFGEIRNRADVIVFWAIDVAQRYPRFESRYAPEPVGTHIPGGRRDRRVVAVDVGAAASTAAEVDHRFAVGRTDELAVLTVLQALVREPQSTTLPVTPNDGEEAWVIAREIAPVLLAGRYVALVFDAEPDERDTRSAQRFDGLFGLSHALSQRARCAAVALRGGGNRSGADVVLTAQTGYPLGIDFARGYPRYDPFADPTATHDVGLVIGDAAVLPRSTLGALERSRTIVIGPSASGTPLGSTGVTIDTGIAGIHAPGTAVRADDVPLPLRPPLIGPSAAEVVRSLAQRISATRRKRLRPERATAP